MSLSRGARLTLIVATAVTAANGRAQEPTAAAAIVAGIVVDSLSGDPIPLADVSVVGNDASVFASTSGTFAFSLVPGTHHLLVRRIGYLPRQVAVTVSAGQSDSVRVVLRRFTVRLAEVRVSDLLCSSATRAIPDTNVIGVLMQLRLNAERARLLARRYPHELLIERRIQEGAAGTRSRYAYGDTILVPSETEWKYAPGNLVIPDYSFDRALPAELLVLPQLEHFADSLFQATHCFRYAGMATKSGRRMIRVDVEPAPNLRVPDVRGSLYLDPDGFQLRYSALRYQHRAGAGLWDIAMETWFEDWVAGLPMIARVSGRTTYRSSRDDRSAVVVQSEDQRVLDVRFVGASPGVIALAASSSDMPRSSSVLAARAATPESVASVSPLLTAFPSVARHSDVLAGVVSDADGLPVVAALVVAGGFSARTDSVGAFTLRIPIADTVTVQVRRLGFEPLRFSVSRAQAVQNAIAIELTQVAHDLTAVEVVEREMRAMTALRHFDERRKLGLGAYITREQIERRNVANVVDLLRDQPSIRVMKHDVIFTRHEVRNCRPDVYLDGQFAPGLDMLSFHTMEIEGIELYSGIATLPPEFARPNRVSCGAIVIWTRRPIAMEAASRP